MLGSLYRSRGCRVRPILLPASSEKTHRVASLEKASPGSCADCQEPGRLTSPQGQSTISDLQTAATRSQEGGETSTAVALVDLGVYSAAVGDLLGTWYQLSLLATIFVPVLGCIRVKPQCSSTWPCL